MLRFERFHRIDDENLHIWNFIPIFAKMNKSNQLYQKTQKYTI